MYIACPEPLEYESHGKNVHVEATSYILSTVPSVLGVASPGPWRSLAPAW